MGLGWVQPPKPGCSRQSDCYSLKPCVSPISKLTHVYRAYQIRVEWCGRRSGGEFAARKTSWLSYVINRIWYNLAPWLVQSRALSRLDYASSIEHDDAAPDAW